ncbi:leucine carboxyl methyltransferase 1-like [Dendronephthya gigantea]|uniref:leucine carboxyl methyltransferase 1-like n=1 Tax=Dendronephthya gigantea TaxID=151771 RepID=UPI001069C4D2|nr:leucine carboxyl methyltransferase 1-like [Dendronephthya gigantea]
MMHSQDDGVIATNDDASICKRFAVQLGYWQDNYIQHFVKNAERKAPEINRGYYARVKGIETILLQFLELTKNVCQVINLGSGFDTRYWQLKEACRSPKTFYEVDFGAVTSRKCMAIRRRKPLQAYFNEQDLQYGTDGISASDYHLIASDLRNVGELDQKLTARGLEKSLPTIFIMECVMVYLHPQEAECVIKWAGESFKNAVFLNYEQVNMDDTFGKVMINNLKRRQCDLQGALACPTVDSQVERFKRLSWSDANALDMSTVYQRLPYEDRQRIERLEMLDEVDLFYQLLNHYCISWAFNDEGQTGFKNLGFH